MNNWAEEGNRPHIWVVEGGGLGGEAGGRGVVGRGMDHIADRVEESGD